MASRRSFIKQIAAASTALPLGVAAAHATVLPTNIDLKQRIGPNDRIRVASIGMGIIGFSNMQTFLQVPGVELVGVADCYDARLDRSKELFGSEITVTRDYEELLAREDVDAVLINTPDHWHQKIAIDALKAGKHVRVEKPMVQKIEQGQAIIDAQKAAGKILQVGSQGISSVVTEKARQLFESGAIGELNMIEGTVSRNGAMGAWQYSIPSDASPETIDWGRFQGDAPQRAFDADRFFRWRKYWDYGTGVAGDMFVHRFTTLHRIIGSLGPRRAMSMGGVRYWNDGRDAPDVIVCIYDYPETVAHPGFTLVMKANLADGSDGGPDFKLIGSEGMLELRGNAVTLSRSRASSPPSVNSLVDGYNSVRTFGEMQRKQFAEEFVQYKQQASPAGVEAMGIDSSFSAPAGYDTTLAHAWKFCQAIREGTPIVEDATYGLRAAAPSLMANLSYEHEKEYRWDPVGLKLNG